MYMLNFLIPGQFLLTFSFKSPLLVYELIIMQLKVWKLNTFITIGHPLTLCQDTGQNSSV